MGDRAGIFVASVRRGDPSPDAAASALDTINGGRAITPGLPLCGRLPAVLGTPSAPGRRPSSPDNALCTPGAPPGSAWGCGARCGSWMRTRGDQFGGRCSGGSALAACVWGCGTGCAPARPSAPGTGRAPGELVGFMGRSAEAHALVDDGQMHVMPAVIEARLADAFPPQMRRVYARRYKNVKNGAALKDALISAARSTDEDARRRMDYAFIDGRMLTSQRHLLTACIQAVVASQRAGVGCKTPSVHSEILWTLSPGNNVRPRSSPGWRSAAAFWRLWRDALAGARAHYRGAQRWRPCAGRSSRRDGRAGRRDSRHQ